MPNVNLNVPSLFSIKKPDGTLIASNEIEARMLPFFLTDSVLLRAGLVNFVFSAESGKKGGYIRMYKKERQYDDAYTEANKNDAYATPKLDELVVELKNYRKSGIETETLDTALFSASGEIEPQTVYDVNYSLDNSRDIRYFETVIDYFEALSAADKTNSTIVANIEETPTYITAGGLLIPILNGIGDIVDTVDDYYKGVENSKLKLIVSQRFETWYRTILAITGAKIEYYMTPVSMQPTGNLQIGGIEVLVAKELGKGFDPNGKRVYKTGGHFPAGTIDLTGINGILTSLEASGVEQSMRQLSSTIEPRSSNPIAMGKSIDGSWIWPNIAKNQLKILKNSAG